MSEPLMENSFGPFEAAKFSEPALSRVDGVLHVYGVALPDGPWHDELDVVAFEYNGLPCLLARGLGAAWCGYVGLPAGHPWADVDLREGAVGDGCAAVSVHGGVTSQGSSVRFRELDFRVIGFDCGHMGSGDLVPANSSGVGEYRDVSYACCELVFLAQQVASVAASATQALPGSFGQSSE